jgi:hypothetical protein
MLGVGSDMVRRVIRLVLTAVIAYALTFGFVQGALHAQAAMPSVDMISHHDHPCGSMLASGDRASPEKSTTPACLTDLGCLLVVGLPTTSAPTVRPYKWAVVDYWSQTVTVRGISFQPAIGPPISAM